MYTSITGAFMFIAIEGNEALERFAQIPSKRVETAMRLWQISCCEVNVFNKTVFEERWVIFHQLCPEETPFIAVIVFVSVVIFLCWPSHGSWFNHFSSPTFHFLFPALFNFKRQWFHFNIKKKTDDTNLFRRISVTTNLIEASRNRPLKAKSLKALLRTKKKQKMMLKWSCHRPFFECNVEREKHSIVAQQS